MTSNPFSNEPTIHDPEEKEKQDWGDDDVRPKKVQEDYSDISDRDYEIRTDGDTPEEEYNEEWPPATTIYANYDQDDFVWVVVTVDDDGIPHVRHETHNYEEFQEKCEWYEARYTLAEGVHVRRVGEKMTNRNVYRQMKGDDLEYVLDKRGLK